jgi:hypothetical protein
MAVKDKNETLKKTLELFDYTEDGLEVIAPPSPSTVTIAMRRIYV